MKRYSLVLTDALENVIDELTKREDKSITEIFIMALEDLAVSEGLVPSVVELYIQK